MESTSTRTSCAVGAVHHGRISGRSAYGTRPHDEDAEYPQHKITSGVTVTECKNWCAAIPECIGITHASATRCDIHTEGGVTPSEPAGFPGFDEVYLGHTASSQVKLHAALGSSCGAGTCCFRANGRPSTGDPYIVELSSVEGI